jgi:chorismate mutase
MVSTGSTEAIQILVKELQDSKGEALTCDQVSVRAVALGSKRALETLEVRQVLITLLKRSPCEQVREFIAGALGSIRDAPQVRQILLEALYNDTVLSVRKNAVVALWSDPNKPHVVNSYFKQLNQETDPQRQQQLLDDYRSLQKNWNPLPTEFIQNFQTIQKDFTNEKIRDTISVILGVEREKALTSYEQQLEYRDKGYGIYPDYVRAGYIDSISLFLPSLSSKEIERIQTLSEKETNPELQKALLNLLEERQMLQKEKAQ